MVGGAAADYGGFGVRTHGGARAVLVMRGYGNCGILEVHGDRDPVQVARSVEERRRRHAEHVLRALGDFAVPARPSRCGIPAKVLFS